MNREDNQLRNCLDCSVQNECPFGKAVGIFKTYEGSDEGIGIVVKLTLENIKQYVKCSYEDIWDYGDVIYET